MVLSTEGTEIAEGAGVGVSPTIAAALVRAENRLARIAGEEARIEAEVLLRQALGIDRAHLLARMTEVLSEATASAFDVLLARRLRREPLRYIVGSCEFYGVEIACTRAALIPRPETEMLVEFAIEASSRRGGIVRFADVGTGSGAIAVAIAANAPNATVVATDASADALALAATNVERYGIGDRVTLVKSDLLAGLGEFDVIVANLPYVSESEWIVLEPEVRDHEPKSALVGGATGLEIIERLLEAAPAHLSRGGALALEIGADQGAATTRLARERFPDASICVTKDLVGHDRVLEVRTSA